MTSSALRKKHGLPTEKTTGRGTPPTVAKNMGYRRKKHHRRRKHTLPMQKTWPTVAKNIPSHQDRRKKHLPPLQKHLPREPSQKTRKLATVAKNMSYRRKKHATPTKESLQVSLVGRWSCCPASNWCIDRVSIEWTSNKFLFNSTSKQRDQKNRKT